MRHVVSVLAMLTFGVLALGSGSGESDPVSGRYDGPSEVVAGQTFPFVMHVVNDGDAAVVIEHVVVPGDAERALEVAIPHAVVSEPYGDGTRYAVPNTVVPPHGETKLGDFTGVPHLSGYQSASIQACEGNGECHTLYVQTRVRGGADTAMKAEWSAPGEVVAGETFQVTLVVTNESGADDLLESAGFSATTASWLSFQKSDPPDKGAGDELAREVWRYDLGLAPGESRTLTFDVSTDQIGEHELGVTHCPASETFCRDHTLPLTVRANDGATEPQ